MTAICLAMCTSKCCSNDERFTTIARRQASSKTLYLFDIRGRSVVLECYLRLGHASHPPRCSCVAMRNLCSSPWGFKWMQAPRPPARRRPFSISELLYTCNLCAIEVALDRGQGVDTFSRLDGNRGRAEPDLVCARPAALDRAKQGNLDEMLAAGLFRIQAEAPRQYRSTATMNA